MGFCGDNHIRGWKKKSWRSVFLCARCERFLAKMNHISLTSIPIVFIRQALFELVNVWPFIQKTFLKAKMACQELHWTFRMQRWVRQNLEGERAGNYNMVYEYMKQAHVFRQQRRAILSSLVKEDWWVQEGCLEVVTAELRFKGWVGAESYL